MDDDGLSCFPFRVCTRGNDDAGSVAAGDEVWFGEERVVGAVVENEDVSIIERDGLDSHDGLFWAWLWKGAEIVEDEVPWGGDLPGAVEHG